MQYSKNNPYNDYSVYLQDLTKNGDEYFNEQICTEYKLKHNYHMVNEQISFFTWEYDMRKSYISSYLNKSKNLLTRVIVDMIFAVIMTSWFLYLNYLIAAIGMGALGVCFELIFIAIGILPSMGYGLSTLLEYLTSKEISYAVRISKFLGKELPGNELKNLHIELAEIQRKIVDLEELSETLYEKAEDLLKNSKPFFMDRDTPFEATLNEDYKATFFRLSMDIDSKIERRKHLSKERDDLLRCHKILREKAITYTIITILAYIMYFTLYYNLSGSLPYIVSIGGFIFVLFPLITSASKYHFDLTLKEDFNRAMSIQTQIEELEFEEKNLRKARDELM